MDQTAEIAALKKQLAAEADRADLATAHAEDLAKQFNDLRASLSLKGVAAHEPRPLCTTSF